MKKPTNTSLVRIAITLQLLLSPLVLAAVAYWVINSDFNGFIQFKINRDGGEMVIDRRNPAIIPASEQEEPEADL